MTFYHLTPVSSNNKTGRMAVSTTSKNSCPDTCPLKANICYAGFGPLALHWRKVTNGERGTDLKGFVKSLRSLRRGTAFRHNQAGDLPQIEGEIDRESTLEIARASAHLVAWTYTHHVISNLHNLNAIKDAIKAGLTINLSANNITEAVQLREQYQMPTVALLPTDAPNVQVVNGHKVVACPAEKSSKVTCDSCRLCAIADRDYIIGFRSHGTGKKRGNLIATVEAA